MSCAILCSVLYLRFGSESWLAEKPLQSADSTVNIHTLENVFVQSELTRWCRHYSDMTSRIQPKGPPFVPDRVILPVEA